MGPDVTRRRILALTGAGTLGTSAGRLIDDVAGATADDSLPSYLDERVPVLLDRYDVPGAAVPLIEDGTVTWSGAYGMAAPESDRPTTVDTLFRVQSITKSVTAWGVVKLVERGDIGLDDPVGRHLTSWELPEAEYPWEDVTVRRLLSHSAGLPAGGYESVPPDEEPPPLRAALSGKAEGPVARPTAEPGSFRYSNPGYALLEVLVEDVTGRDFAEYVDREILIPLGMDDATFDWNDRVRSSLATEHFVDGTAVSPSRGPDRAPGGLYATVEDIARFVAAGMAGPSDQPPGRGVLAPENVGKLHAPVVETTGFYDLATDGAGLGHFVETLSDGERAVMNGGQGPGSWNWFHAVPGTGDGVVVLTNSERSLQLIADAVGAWIDRRRLSSVKLTRAARWLRAPVWLLGVVAAGIALRLGYGVVTGARSFEPSSDRNRTSRVVLASLAVVAAGLWWTLGREFVGYFLPVIAEWSGLGLATIALLVVLTALFPRKVTVRRRD